MASTDALYGELAPVVSALGLDLVDVEVSPATVRVSVDRPGGIDLEGLSAASRAVSSALDQIDPVQGRYTLEVSSPGVERRLRTPEHFARAIGETVAVRLMSGAEPRRVQGTLTAADAGGVTVGEQRIPYEQIDRARTVFEWGAKPAGAKGRKERVRTP